MMNLQVVIDTTTIDTMITVVVASARDNTSTINDVAVMSSLADATTTVIIIMPLKQLIKTANQKLVDAGFKSVIVKLAADIPHQAGYIHLFMRPDERLGDILIITNSEMEPDYKICLKTKINVLNCIDPLYSG